ncbi:helix-turn-helix domain-containing protein [Mesobacillus stamsii]|uniref:Transcriptional regulator with XRE-family HTH domain n=1 Tax=Mesobacillus stamsii TaxID=225347 RepID=A0ABU0FTQ8_9BACI|nr:helix-turn-helix transcriptional regulator [Mesobacillus stamsii]MDQ0412748.1 transcriptional regulator with XRE-family HTH domain [Mesobacillus stamsii]
MNNGSIGAQLRIERLKRSMSQKDVSEKTNISVRLLGQIENNKGNHRESTLKLLIDFYGLGLMRVSRVNKNEK